MNYLLHYYNLCTSRQNMQRSKGQCVYYEAHHIMPKSMGGSNDKSNIVLLTPREHYIAHLLLYNHYCKKECTTIECRKMAFAMVSMTSKSKNLIDRDIKLNSRQYNIIREAAAKASLGKKIENTSNYKKPKSALHKENIRLARLSAPPRSEKTKEKLKGYAVKRKHLAFKNYEYTTCTECGKTGQRNAMLRWHFDNCKYIKGV